MQNGLDESFNGKCRDECLNVEWFRNRHEAMVLIEQWRQDYNAVRPHSSLGYRTPRLSACRSSLRLLHNEIGVLQHWLEVRLVGEKSNRFGIGARVGLLRDGAPPRWRRVHTDSSYLSASDVRVHFGLGERSDVRGLVVQWPDGSSEAWDTVKADRVVVLRQGTGRPR